MNRLYSITGYNVVRDGAFGGDTAAYEAYRDTTAAVARIGTAICGTYTAVHGGNVCFVAGTAVLTVTGTIAIEDIRAGDYVWAWDEETGDVALKKVVETYINETDELVHIHVNGEEIICTPSHPFYSPVKGWTEAVNLRAGDILVLVNGEYVVVEKVQHELLESPVKVYNFQVEGYHTYYVSNAGVLVHNTCSQTGTYRIDFDDGYSYIGKGSQARMHVSAKYRSLQHHSNVINTYWEAAVDDTQAFIKEYQWMKAAGFGTPGAKLYNVIQSPGLKKAIALGIEMLP